MTRTTFDRAADHHAAQNREACANEAHLDTDLDLEDEIKALAAKLPKHWVICDGCSGEGRHSKGLGCFSSDDLAELGHEWQDDYFSGRFDRQCEDCAGSGKLKIVDYDAAEQRMPEVFAEWSEKTALLHQIDREFEAESRLERIMGC